MENSTDDPQDVSHRVLGGMSEIPKVANIPEEEDPKGLVEQNSVESIPQKAARQKHEREQKIREAIKNVAVCCIYVFTGLMGTVIVIRVWHLIGCYAWLDDANVSQIDTFLSYVVTGALSGPATRYFSRNMDEE